MTSGGDNFNDFSETQLTAHFAFLCKPTWWNATVSPFSLVLISFGAAAFPNKYLWETAFSRVLLRLHHWTTYAVLAWSVWEKCVRARMIL